MNLFDRLAHRADVDDLDLLALPVDDLDDDQAGVLLADLLGIRPPGWLAEAACLDVDDPERFFDDQDQAVAVCDGCPVRVECHDYAVRHRLREGVWGGLTERERAQLLPPEPPAPDERRWCACGCGQPAPARGRGATRDACRQRAARQRRRPRAA